LVPRINRALNFLGYILTTGIFQGIQDLILNLVCYNNSITDILERTSLFPNSKRQIYQEDDYEENRNDSLSNKLKRNTLIEVVFIHVNMKDIAGT
jgi:hypothetical protein